MEDGIEQQFAPKEKEQKDENDPYTKSTLFQKVAAAKKLFLTDFDGTFITNSKTTEHDTNTLRDLLNQKGYALIGITAQTPEMSMSNDEFSKSQERGFQRPAPHLGEEAGKRVYQPPEEIVPTGVLDSDVIAAGNSTIMVKQQDGGYIEDREFAETMRQDSKTWRLNTGNLLDFIDPEKILAIRAGIEKKENYETGVTDVAPPDFRVQLQFDTEQQKFFMIQKIRSLASNKDIPEDIRKQALNMRLEDDSNLARESGKYTLYLTPNRGYKARLAERIVDVISKRLTIPRNQLQGFIAGDAKADTDMILFGGLGTNITGVFVGGSRMTPALTNSEINSYAGEQLGALKNRLSGQNGMYVFKPPLTSERTVIIGDEKYPGTVGPQTLIHVVQELDAAA